MEFAPAPRAVRAGDYVFTSSIYPVDESGHAVTVDYLLGEAGPSLIEVQTRHCLERLKTVLAEQGSSLDRVLKAEVHLADAADFYEFKLVWREYFPQDPPARTTVEVGDTLPFRGARLNLDVIALAGDSRLQPSGPARPGIRRSTRSRMGVIGSARGQPRFLLRLHCEQFQIRHQRWQEARFSQLRQRRRRAGRTFLW
jgi:2-iminobutanoate/2-iminopropanoate deaminase